MSWECPQCDESFKSKTQLADHLESHGEGEEHTITIDNLIEKPTKTGGMNYQIWSEEDELYSMFEKPEPWEDLRVGDTILFKFKKSGDWNNIVPGSIEVMQSSGNEKQPRTARGRAQPQKRKRAFGLTTRELMVKWVMESTARTLQSQEEITEEKLQMVLRNYATYAQTELTQEEENK